MKIINLIVFLIPFFLGKGFSQDPQWIVVNNIGKTGAHVTNGLYVNEFINGDALTLSFLAPRTTSFRIENVKFPKRNGVPPNPLGKNDIFIIYEDWNHFNSREKGAIGSYTLLQDVFYPYGNSNNLSDLNHRLRSNWSSPIKYMYLSKIYEDDDPPPIIHVKNGHASLNSPVYSFTTTFPPPSSWITATHDVVKGVDITLIIKRDSVNNGDILSYNNIRAIGSSGDFIRNIYFEPSNLFNGGTSFSNINCHAVGGEIIIDGLDPSTHHQPPFIYINLKGTPNLPLYFPAPNENLNSEAGFFIKRGGAKLGQTMLTENILGSHDPNFIEVKSVCSDGRNQYVRYRVQFVNTGKKSAKGLAVKLKLPSYLRVNCIADTAFSAGGQFYQGSICKQRSTRFLVFKFPGEATLAAYNRNDPNAAIGYVEFCTTMIKTRDIQSYETDLSFRNPEVYFNKTDKYIIEEFIDLLPEIKINSGKFRPMEGECNCPCNITPDCQH